MKKYFYTDGFENYGPFTLEELKERNITRETQVWFDGMGDWRPAGTVTELAELFKLEPPPLPNTNSRLHSTVLDTSLSKPPKTWLVESILVTLFCCMPFGIAGIVNASRVESKFYNGDTEGAIRASEEAKKWTTVSFVSGLVIGVIYLIIVIAGASYGY